MLHPSKVWVPSTHPHPKVILFSEPEEGGGAREAQHHRNSQHLQHGQRDRLPEELRYKRTRSSSSILRGNPDRHEGGWCAVVASPRGADFPSGRQSSASLPCRWFLAKLTLWLTGAHQRHHLSHRMQLTADCCHSEWAHAAFAPLVRSLFVAPFLGCWRFYKILFILSFPLFALFEKK